MLSPSADGGWQDRTLRFWNRLEDGTEQAGNAWVVPAFDDSSWPAAAVVAEIGATPLGTPWPAQPVDLLRRNFSVARAVRTARIYSTALGSYQL